MGYLATSYEKHDLPFDHLTEIKQDRTTECHSIIFVYNTTQIPEMSIPKICVLHSF